MQGAELVPFDTFLLEDPKTLIIEDPEPKHAKVPGSFVLSANGERYQNTLTHRRKARKAQKAARKRNR